jgi:hypothetical protein
VLAFAGLYEIWRDKEYPEDHPSAWLWTATIITTRAEDTVGQIHDRMPMVIEPARWADWLDPAMTDRADLLSLLAPAMSGGLVSDPVSTAVNAVRNNGPALIEPLATGPDGEVLAESHARSGTGTQPTHRLGGRWPAVIPATGFRTATPPPPRSPCSEPSPAGGSNPEVLLCSAG